MNNTNVCMHMGAIIFRGHWGHAVLNPQLTFGSHDNVVQKISGQNDVSE